MSTVDVHVFPTEAPDDVEGLRAAFEEGRIDPRNVVAVLGKTEGNGCVNDFSRGLATRAYEDLLAEHLAVPSAMVGESVVLMMSGGTEGAMTPHVTVFTRREGGDGAPEGKRLAAGVARTREFEPEAVGRAPQVRETAATVEAAMADAGIADPADVHFVQVKCPLLTAGRMADARERGESVVVEETYESMGYSRGASALGVGVATGELSMADCSDAVCEDHGTYSRVASTSAGVELTRSEVLVLGNSEDAGGALAVGGAVMADPLDAAAVREALDVAGAGDPASPDPDRVVNVFAKAQFSRSGRVRGRRHVVHNDSDINATRHARAVVNSVVGAVTGDPLSYVSGGAEHQGPDGGGPVAAIVRRDST